MPASAPSHVDIPDFDPSWYLSVNEDVRAAGMDPWTHYHSIGRAEGRQPGPSQALMFEHMLWHGLADQAIPALEALMSGDHPREAALAGWVLARWYRDQGLLETAFKAIEVFWQHSEGLRFLGHKGPALLAIQLALATGQPDRARAHLDRALKEHGPCPDLTLAGLTCDRATGASLQTLSAHIQSLYKGTGLSGVLVTDGPGALFDRLTGQAAQVSGSGPLVSVIVPAHNAATTLGHALDGLCAQSWRSLEIIVVDDGSTDKTAQIARNRAEKDPRIRVLVPGRNQGAYPARNAGMAAARGAFITVHDADDWSHPEKIAEQVRPLIEDTTLQGTLSHWVRVTPDLDMSLWRIEDTWIHRNVSSLMIRANLRKTLGYWDRTRASADTEYYYRIMRAFGPASLLEVHPGIPLAFGRTDASSLTGRAETHLRTQFHGLRRDYMEAAFNWHRRSRTPGDLYMGQKPRQRPFRIPPAIGVGDIPGPATPFDRLRDSPLFDPLWYWQAHEDVLAADIYPVRHYLDGGAAEDRDCGPDFSTSAYRLSHDLPDDTPALLHFHDHPQADPLPGFDGALKDAKGPRVMVFGHAAGKTLFGAERSLLDVMARMVARGDVPVMVLPAIRNADYLERLRAVTARIEVIPQLPRRGWRSPATQTVERLRAVIRQHAPREIHVNTLVQDAPLVAARAEGIDSVLHIREMPEQDVTLSRTMGISPDSLRADLLAQADRFVVNSSMVARWLAAPDRTEQRPNAVNPALFDLPFQPGETLHVALISSNITKKGVADFIAVATRVAETARPIRFLLIGPPTPDLHALRPWPDTVDFRGYAPTPLKAIAQADIVVNLSHFAESFGRTVMEAMAAGRPVITYARGTPQELVQSGKTGFVVPADDMDAVARAVLALEAARGQLVAMGRAGKARARTLQALADQDG